jgi:hypothetical protein
MRSVADDLRREDREAIARLAPAERVARALALGRRGLLTFARAQTPPLDADEARRQLEARRQASRRRSACLEALLAAR